MRVVAPSGTEVARPDLALRVVAPSGTEVARPDLALRVVAPRRDGGREARPGDAGCRSEAGRRSRGPTWRCGLSLRGGTEVARPDLALRVVAPRRDGGREARPGGAGCRSEAGRRSRGPARRCGVSP